MYNIMQESKIYFKTDISIIYFRVCQLYIFFANILNRWETDGLQYKQGMLWPKTLYL